MNTHARINKVIESKAIKYMFHGLGMVLILWIVYCAFSVFKSEHERNLLSNKADYETFKEKCVNDNGKVRHEDSLLTFDVYCMEKDGNEQFFYHYFTYNFTIPFVDKVTFGIGELNN